MADVYEAVHEDDGYRAAVKILRASRQDNVEARARFLREGAAASRIRHPNVVRVLNYGESEGIAYLAMEFLDGWSLAEVLQQGRVPHTRAVDLMLVVIGGVSAAHAEGVIHRDLKPDNIFLSRQLNGETVPKVLDFGISRLVDDLAEGRLTLTRSVFGTPGYMPPEQFSGAKHVNAKGDQYALGVVLYEMITGAKAFN